MRRAIITAASCAALSGCFAVFVPGSVVGAVSDSVTGDEGKNCVREHTIVGDRIKLTDGRVGTVQKIEGPSSRCRTPEYPIRALMSF